MVLLEAASLEGVMNFSKDEAVREMQQNRGPSESYSRFILMERRTGLRVAWVFKLTLIARRLPLRFATITPSNSRSTPNETYAWNRLRLRGNHLLNSKRHGSINPEQASERNYFRSHLSRNQAG